MARLDKQTVARHEAEHGVTMLALQYARRELPLIEEKVFEELMRQAKDQGIPAADLTHAYVQVRYSLEV